VTRREEGQATVELALLLPVVTVFVLLVIQVGLVVVARVRLEHGAREAVRVLAVAPDPTAARNGALAGGGLDGDRLQLTSSGRGSPGSVVEVQLRYRLATDVPLVGALVGDVTLQTSAAMRVET
jgi:hypothetical protein